ncbi:hypothetical protein TNCV_2602751 [Trichonephila clavipes]|nr:hypothetical protein TNCV_2602751 [Trichonephila clavipes]
MSHYEAGLCAYILKHCQVKKTILKMKPSTWTVWAAPVFEPPFDNLTLWSRNPNSTEAPTSRPQLQSFPSCWRGVKV